MDSSLPKTPQRGRSMYPAHLAKGDENRVPLHRRGKSKTYERLEDLLREAGYKETRVFTPEAERAEAEAEERRKREGNTDGKSARATGLVSFLAGFVPWNDADTTSRRDRPKTQTQTQSLGRAKGERFVDDSDDGDAWEPGSPTPRRRPFAPVIFTSDYSSPDSLSSTSSRSPPQVPSISSRPKLAPERDMRSTLRHIISVPDFPQRPRQLSQPRRATEMASRNKLLQIRNADVQPPMPTNWMNTVAQAVMSAGSNSGAFAGGPSHHGRGRARPMVPRTSSLARRGFTPHSPRARMTQGVVTAASVVCHSAPGSRSTSLVRKQSSRAIRNGNGNGNGRGCDLRVPSLGVMTVEFKHEDWAGDGSPTVCLDSESEDDDDDSDGGELDFARLLVPARRQHSIHSLRRHLHNHNAAITAASGTRQPSRFRQSNAYTGAASATSTVRRVLRGDSHTYAGVDRDGVPDDDYDAFQDSLAQDLMRSRRGSVDEADGLASWAAYGLPGLEGAARKKRGAMPWMTWGTQGR